MSEMFFKARVDKEPFLAHLREQLIGLLSAMGPLHPMEPRHCGLLVMDLNPISSTTSVIPGIAIQAEIHTTKRHAAQ